MYEFHGWITVRAYDADDPELSVMRERERQALGFIEGAIKEHTDDFSLFETRSTSNGLLVLLAHGLRNHTFAPVVNLFRTLGEELPESYGLLYVFDDERPVMNNEFRVWRLARGMLIARVDIYLSPYFPTVERLPVEGPRR